MASCTLAAVGDIALARDAASAALKHGPAYLFEHAKPVFHDADVLFGNMEAVLQPPAMPASMEAVKAMFGPDEAWETLRDAGFDVLNHASNHVLDCGWKGLAHTRQRILDAGAQVIGTCDQGKHAKQPAIIEKNGLNLGFLGYVETTNATLAGGGGRVAYFDLYEAAQAIETLRSQVDTVIVSLHAGLEFREGPSLPRVSACRQLADAGADVILCHHPHVPQGVEMHGNSLICYSLGNFVFAQGPYMRENGPHTADAHILLVDLDENGGVSGWRRELFGINMETGRPEPLAATERAVHEQHYAALDALVADPERLRAVWYESAQAYLNIWWPIITRDGPEKFIENHAWRILGLAEHEHWTCGVLEQALNRARTVVEADFEWQSPNAPWTR